jgi:putative sigma-54 modulation protein
LGFSFGLGKSTGPIPRLFKDLAGSPTKGCSCGNSVDRNQLLSMCIGRIVNRPSEYEFAGRPALHGGLFNPESTGGLFMNLTISGHHLEVTPALRNYVTTKLDRITRHFDQVVDIRVLLTVEKQKEKERRQRAECKIHVKGNDMFAESSHEDLYAALDELVDKLDRQVGKHKTRLQDHHHEAPKRVM